jgi:predicted ATPase with chaperone activity
MRAPLPTQQIEREAEAVVLATLDRLDLRMMQQMNDAAAWAQSPEGEQWLEETIATAPERQEQARLAAIRARRNRRKAQLAKQDKGRLTKHDRGKKRGNYEHPRSMNYLIAKQWLPLIERALQNHFRARQPMIRVTRTWALELLCRCCDIDENNFRNFTGLRGMRRP